MSNATIRVQFGSGALEGDHLSAEVDDRAIGLNEGKTAFLPGDTAWFLVYRSAGLALTLDSSAGSVMGGDEVYFNKTEDVSFEASAAAALPVPARSILDVLWIGRSLGNLQLGADGMSLTAATSGVAIARVTYAVKAVSYGLASPESVAGLNDFDVLVMITGSRPNLDTSEEAA